jgi:hypothetical protein
MTLSSHAKRALPALLVATLALTACGGSGRSAADIHPREGYDDLVVQDSHTRTMLLAADPTFGPDHFVYASVKIPENYLADGAIHLTNGRELRIVSPHAFKAYSGKALTVEEAEDVIARARTLDASADEFLVLVRTMRKVLEDRAAAVADAKVRAIDRAEWRRSERHLARNQEAFDQLVARREELSVDMQTELGQLDAMLANLQQAREALEAEERAMRGPGADDSDETDATGSEEGD